MQNLQMLKKTKYSSQPKWESAGRELGKAHDKYQFDLGDWLNDGENFLGEESRYMRGAELTHKSPAVLRDFAYVARSCRYRNDALGWHHHKAVAPLPPEKQKEFLKQAQAQRESVAELRETPMAVFTLTLVQATGHAPSVSTPPWWHQSHSKLRPRSGSA